jgi:hypothetical protein
LYSIIDFITFLVLRYALVESGGALILLGSSVVCLVMFIILYYKKGIICTWKEKSMIMFIIFCIFTWIIIGPKKAIICGIASEFIVGLYLAIKTFRFPVVKYNLLGYSLFLLTCIISIFDAPDWSLYEIGYPVSEVVITTVTIIPLLIQWRKEKILKIQKIINMIIDFSFHVQIIPFL